MASKMRAERLTKQLLRQKYRSADASDSDTGAELNMCPPGCTDRIVKEQEAAAGFTEAQVDAALQIMMNHTSSALKSANFEAFAGRKKSWQELASGVISSPHMPTDSIPKHFRCEGEI